MAFQITQFLVALGIGVLIGLEREMEIQRKKLKDFLGIRTFALIALFGAITGFLAGEPGGSIFVVVAFSGFFLMLIANYVVVGMKLERKGLTTELSALLAFVLGFLTTLGFMNVAIPAAIVVLIFLTLKKPLHEFAAHIQASEMYATIKFAVIALVILPFLPNKNFTPMDIPVVSDIIRAAPLFSVDVANALDVFNPYKIWLMVVFISGISFVGYVLIKTIGTDKGLGLTGFLGGLVSSTAVTSSLSLESKRLKSISLAAVFGVVIAASTMFFRVLIEILVINSSLLKLAFVPLMTMAVVGVVSALLVWRKIRKQHQHNVEFSSPFQLAPALKFALFFGFVLFISKLGLILFGTKGLFIAAFLSGLADVDAITLTMANLALTGDISGIVAVSAITIAAVTNTIVKGGIAYLFGSRAYSKWVVLIFGVMTALGLLSIFLL